MTPLKMIAEKDFAGHQAIGKRSDQEDTYAFSEIPVPAAGAPGLLLVVADGMGGHSAGQRASEIAVRTFVAAFQRGGETMRDRFTRSLDAANEALAEAIEADPDHLEGMGTTILAVAATPLGFQWISVGDSPLYLLRDGILRRLNADHSFRPVLCEMVARGEITEEQAAASFLRNRLRAALIGGEIALIDVSSALVPLREGDIVLAGSDGLQTLSDESIAEVLRSHAEAEASPLVMCVVQAVLDVQHPKQDNLTAAILKPPGGWLLAPH